MAGEYSGTVAESGGGYELLGMLKNLGREEILEVFSGGEEFCQHCKDVLQSRIQNIINKKTGELSVSSGNSRSSSDFWSGNSFSLSSETNAKSSSENTFSSMLRTPERVNSGIRKGFVNPSPASVNTQQPSFHGTSKVSVNGGFNRVASPADIQLLDDREEYNRFAQISRKKDYSHIEKINGKATNVLRGLELHKNVFSSEEQKKIVESVYNLQRMGQNGQLRERTYSEPKKWMRGKGRVTIQFGCCYNYAVDKNGNPPGIVRDEEVDPLPPLFKQMIKRMIRMHVLPPTCVPNSCIVNIYDEGDCIPPHIDHHDFLRPFCTISFLTECNILFGMNLTIVNAGEFAGPVSIPLPVGSVLVLNGNGADIAKHCVPAVPARRISITFRRMDDSKIPYNFSSDPELKGLKPLVYSTSTKSPVQQNQQENGHKITHHEAAINMVKASNTSIFSEKDDFPPLGNSHPVNSSRTSGNGWRR